MTRNKPLTCTSCLFVAAVSSSLDGGDSQSLDLETAPTSCSGLDSVLNEAKQVYVDSTVDTRQTDRQKRQAEKYLQNKREGSLRASETPRGILRSFRYIHAAYSRGANSKLFEVSFAQFGALSGDSLDTFRPTFLHKAFW